MNTDSAAKNGLIDEEDDDDEDESQSYDDDAQEQEIQVLADQNEPRVTKIVTILFMSHRVQAKVYDTDTQTSLLQRVSNTQNFNKMFFYLAAENLPKH